LTKIFPFGEVGYFLVLIKLPLLPLSFHKIPLKEQVYEVAGVGGREEELEDH
jgi:hypothetical protein